MDQFVERPNYWSSTNKSALAFLVVFMTMLGGHGRSFASPESIQLYLEVFLNEYPTHLIGAFTQLSDARIAANPSELKQIGIKTTLASSSEHPVPLDSIPGLSYDYDVANQRIEISVPPSGLVHRNFGPDSAYSTPLEVRSSLGGVLNYGLFGRANSDDDQYEFSFSGASVDLDGRLFSDMGTLDMSGIIGTTTFSQFSALRLDTTWSYSDPETTVTWRIGDAISGGLAWTRPIRIGGFQVQRNFALRPDLITMPLPAFSGTAAVPSTVDVFVNNVKNFSKDIPPGPFTISNLPIVSGAGTARVVIRETSGRVTETETAFYASPQLLRAGLTDFSAEGGFVRQLYGVESGSYHDEPVASGSVRYGVDETLTLEGHAEAGLGLINAGMGLVTQLGTFGVFTLAGSVDHYDGEVGTQIYAGLEADFRGIKFYANTQRQAVGNYIDLATLSGKGVLDQIGGLRLADLKPATAIDRISMSLPLPVLDTRLNVGFVHTEYASEEDRYLFNTSYSHRLTKRLSLFANGFYDFADDASLGVYAGLSMCLGDWGHGQLSVSENSGSTRVEATYSKTAKHEPGSFGWRTRTSEGEYASREVSLAYHGSKARVEGTVTQHADTLSGFAYVSGAVAFADGSVFASNRIYDAFAVVDAGVPDVEVFYENRPIGHTGSTGKLLVTGLRSYQRNKISIDPLNLPVNADIPQTEAFVAPADRHGILVKFNIRTDDTSAVVTFETVDGKALPVSSLGVVSATEEEFVIGYGGQAFIKNLSAQNEVTIDTGQGMCAASFPFTPQHDTQVIIEKVICRW